ncbi:MAG: class I SAM-dependent methyltransferase [Bryobacteraceae bacterium]
MRSGEMARADQAAYGARLAAEVETYANCLHVHELPPIFHYWSETYIRPKLEAFGYTNPNEIFGRHFDELCERSGPGARFLSIGSGNCDVEIETAVHLRSQGHSRFVIDCVDLNPAMLERGMAAAASAGVAQQIAPVQVDFNHWNPAQQYEGVMANQSLHHVVNLEGLFSRIKPALKAGGRFVISDIIGRNGHQRWPEALEIVHEFWRKLPPSYRFNRQLERYEELYENVACPGENFEGVRAQDILPLLLDTFHFQFFLGFANIIEPFVDRSFGPNFDAAAAWDRAFIDAVHLRDEQEMSAGRIKPTHMLAVVSNDPGLPTVFPSSMSPQSCLRHPDIADTSGVSTHPYQIDGWPPDMAREIEMGRLLGEAQRRIDSLKADLEQKTEWGVRLDKDVEQRTAWAFGLEKSLQERTAWAQSLERDVQDRTAWARRLESELQDRTAWAMELSEDLRRIRWVWRLDRLSRRAYRETRNLASHMFRRLKPKPGAEV